jgi:uncharacterized damage-inducible protein DinB
MIMINSLQEFIQTWTFESASTVKLLQQLTDQSLHQEVYPGGRTLGRLVNHVVETLTELPSKLQLGITEEHPHYTTAAELVCHYERCSAQLIDAIKNKWTDADLKVKNEMYGEEWTNAFSLQVLLMHQAHHRGQMTVLMRQAGLVVPGMYGPAREEWAHMGLPEMA